MYCHAAARKTFRGGRAPRRSRYRHWRKDRKL